jgi:hypothetical protein
VQANLPSMVEADGRLRLDYGRERLVLDRGLQPSLVRTRSGALVVQAQIPEKPAPSDRMHYPSAIATVISRDGGDSWAPLPINPGGNGLNLEGGAVELRDGTILALDTYVTPGARPDEGSGQLYTSADDWRTLRGPEEVVFELPGIDFYASKDDTGQMKEDKTPSTYMPTMMKARVMLARSTDRGRRWKLVSTAAVDPQVGTEGFDEPVLARISRGRHAGRLLCMMRTGRELYETTSDDEGATWTRARPRVFAGLDVYRTELFVSYDFGFWGQSVRYVYGRTVKVTPRPS